MNKLILIAILLMNLIYAFQSKACGPVPSPTSTPAPTETPLLSTQLRFWLMHYLVLSIALIVFFYFVKMAWENEHKNDYMKIADNDLDSKLQEYLIKSNKKDK